MKLNINWRVYVKLFILGLLGSISAVPYLFFILQHNERLRVSLPEIIFNQIAQAFITLIPILLIGLMLARRIGFHLPFLENWKEKKSEFWIYIKQTVIYGIFITTYILLANSFIYQLGIKPEARLREIPPLIDRILASFYAGINEEIVFRLFATSFMIWLVTKVRFQKRFKSLFNIWFGIILSSIFFSLANFSFPGNLANLKYPLLLRAIALNFIPGMVYGFLYWKKGLEAAMFSHFFSALLLQII